MHDFAYAILRGYYMAFFISHPITTRETHISQKVEGQTAKMGVSG